MYPKKEKKIEHSGSGNLPSINITTDDAPLYCIQSMKRTKTSNDFYWQDDDVFPREMHLTNNLKGNKRYQILYRPIQQTRLSKGKKHLPSRSSNPTIRKVPYLYKQNAEPNSLNKKRIVSKEEKHEKNMEVIYKMMKGYEPKKDYWEKMAENKTNDSYWSLIWNTYE